MQINAQARRAERYAARRYNLLVDIQHMIEEELLVVLEDRENIDTVTAAAYDLYCALKDLEAMVLTAGWKDQPILRRVSAAIAKAERKPGVHVEPTPTVQEWE